MANQQTQRRSLQQTGQGDPPSLQQEQSLPAPLISKLWKKQRSRVSQHSLPRPAQQSTTNAGNEGSLSRHEDAFDPADSR